MMKYLPLSIIVVILVGSCIPQDTCSRGYTFHFPATLSPAKDTFSVGDTLWYEMNVNNLVEDQETGDMVDLSELNLYFEVLSARYDVTYFNNSLLNFSFHSAEGEFYLASPIGYMRANTNDKIKIAIVPQYSGGYVLTFTLGINLLLDPIEIGGKCTEFIKPNSRVLINNGNSTINNVSVLEDLYLIDGVDTLYWVENGINIEEDMIDIYTFYVR